MHTPATFFLVWCPFESVSEEESWVCLQRRSTRFYLEISLAGEEENRQVFELAGVIFLLRSEIKSFCKTADTFAWAWPVPKRKDLWWSRHQLQGRLLGECLPCSLRNTEFLDRMLTVLGNTWYLVLWPGPSNQKVAALLQSVTLDAPGRLPELVTAGLLLWLVSICLFTHMTKLSSI